MYGGGSWRVSAVNIDFHVRVHYITDIGKGGTSRSVVRGPWPARRSRRLSGRTNSHMSSVGV